MRNKWAISPWRSWESYPAPSRCLASGFGSAAEPENRDVLARQSCPARFRAKLTSTFSRNLKTNRPGRPVATVHPFLASLLPPSMKPRVTLTLAAIAGVLFAYIWFVDRHQSSTKEEADASAKVLQLDKNKVSRHDSKITLPAPTSQSKGADQLKEYGLQESDLSVKLATGDAKDTEILLGKDSAIEGKVYLRQQGQNTVYVVRDTLRSLLTRKPDDFRDHKLASIPIQSIQKLNVKTAEGELELERKSGHWNLTKPMRARGADSKVNDLLASVLNANLTQFLPATPTPDQGLSEPRATLTLQLEGQSEPVLLQIGASPEGEENKGKSFAKLSSRAAVTVLPNNTFDPLLKARPNDLRDRKLLRVESDIVDRITIEAAGKPALVLARKGESWAYKTGDSEGPVREGLAAKLLTDLQAAESVNFVADLATDLSKYGLAEPLLKIRLSSFASANTAEAQAGEKPIVSVLFGSVEGESGYAKLDDEPFIVATPKTLLASCPTETKKTMSPASPPFLPAKRRGWSKQTARGPFHPAQTQRTMPGSPGAR
ncbi:MAG: DUF4340 domain-containing protein [Verrucomicrobia bacterium]|nr:DUF4340 domain-containing protein [Verrucomicrobiota bacterium]